MAGLNGTASHGPTGPNPPPVQIPSRPPARQWTDRNRIMAAGVVLAILGLIGSVFTYVALARHEQSQGLEERPTAFLTRILPGVIGDPGRYGATAGGTRPTPAGADALYRTEYANLKGALDRWLALLLVGVAALLFASGMPLARAAEGKGRWGSSVPADVAPFVLLAAVAYFGLSFFEIP